MNVVLVTVDCFRYDRCGFNGHHRPTTPVLNDLAEEAYVFHDAFTTGPQTVDSFPGFVAGLHSHNGAYCQDSISWKALPNGTPTLGSYFGDHGYDTAAVLTNTFITEDQNYDEGFDVFENVEMRSFGGPGRDAPDDGDPDANSIELLLNRFTSTARAKLQKQESVYNPYMVLFVAYQYRRKLFGWPTVHAEEVIDEFVGRIDDLSEPFFAWTHLMDLHAPIHPDVVDDELSAAGSLFRHFVAEGARDGHIHYPLFDTIYDGALSYVDAQIGRIVDHLDRRGVLDETLVIVTGDHGDALFDRGIYGHPTHYLYNELLRVPFLVRVPGGETTHVHEPFSLAWLHELLAEALDWEPAPFPATSGRESHLDPSDERVVVLSDSISKHGHTVAVQNGEHKYLTHFGETNVEHNAIRTDTCYRTVSDVWERKPLDGEVAPTPLRELAKEVRTDPADLPSIEHQSNAAVMDRLEQLGYKM